MKFNEQWLREWVNPPITSDELASQLTMAGLEIESSSPVAADFNGVVVGEVLEVKPHPDADRLRVCTVTVGEASPLTIVCGAANVRPHLKIPVALIGAILSPTLTIKKAKLRGVESSGMLCSSSELGLTETSSGLLELPEDAPIGIDIRNYLQLNDQIFDLKITPNRGDCLSIQGIAREVAALNTCKLHAIENKTAQTEITDTFPIKLQASHDCPRYVGRIIRNINIAAVIPLWMQERLRRAGQRCINPVVDIVNYVMLELGQPMHAFDLQKLDQCLNIRRSKSGERIHLLNEQEIELDDETLVIADAKMPHAIAGVMGGSVSGVSLNTKDIFLESAFFQPLTIGKTVRRYHLHSDSSQRFERGVDPELQIRALERASELLLSVVGGQAGPWTEELNADSLPKNKKIRVRQERISGILGISLTPHEITNILSRLNMTLSSHDHDYDITAPSYRFDIEREIDVIEELARIYGYENIPKRLPIADLSAQTLPENKIPLSRFRNLLVDQGYHEVITYSFVSDKLQKLFDPSADLLMLANPISQDMSVMRAQLWPGLLQVALYNQNRQEERVRIFETGLSFIQEKEKLLQQPRLAGLISGSIYPRQWGSTSRVVDFFDIKNDVQLLLALTGDLSQFQFKPVSVAALNPGKSAAIYRNNHLIGYLGALHPTLEQTLELQGPVYLFELDLTYLQQGKVPVFQTVSKFPAIRRDIAIIVQQISSIAAIKEKIINSVNDLLKNVEIFDIYHGKGIDKGYKSVALGLTFQHSSRTLVETEINDLMQKIIAALQHEFGAKLRE